MKTNLKFIMIALFTLAITACSPEDGKDGIDGEQGIPGQNGNANVMASEWIPVQFPTSPVQVTDFDIVDLRITREIALNSMIVVYGKINNSYAIIPWPFQFWQKSYYAVILYNESKIRFIARTTDNSIAVFNSFNEVRYFIIPLNETYGRSSGEIHANLQKMGVDINDYNAVVKYYNIKE